MIQTVNEMARLNILNRADSDAQKSCNSCAAAPSQLEALHMLLQSAARSSACLLYVAAAGRRQSVHSAPGGTARRLATRTSLVARAEGPAAAVRPSFTAAGGKAAHPTVPRALQLLGWNPAYEPSHPRQAGSGDWLVTTGLHIEAPAHVRLFPPPSPVAATWRQHTRRGEASTLSTA